MTSLTALLRPPVLRRWVGLPILVLALLPISGCGEKKKARVETQVAARVAGEDITVQQINQVLQEQRNLRPELADAAGRLVLERLIDQQLAVQKAESLKLERDPRVQQQLEAARRQVLARAYAERTGESAARPTPAEVSQYYQDKPALYRERRVFSIQELAIEARPEQLPGLRQQLETAKSIGEFVEYLKSEHIRFAANQAVRASEQLNPAALETLLRMKEGQASLLQGSSGVQVIVLVGSRPQPIAEEQARALIEQQLLAERRRKVVEDDLKALRAAATVEYLGPFAGGDRPGTAASGVPVTPAGPADAGSAGSSATR